MVIACLSIIPFLAFAGGGEMIWKSENGRFQVTYESQLDPIQINRIHSWTLHVEDAAGQPVSDAEIAVKGGMPAHNHGLATAPTVEARGNGDYLLEGLRFHMMGHWELELTITAQGQTDKVIIPLDL